MRCRRQLGLVQGFVGGCRLPYPTTVACPAVLHTTRFHCEHRTFTWRIAWHAARQAAYRAVARACGTGCRSRGICWFGRDSGCVPLPGAAADVCAPTPLSCPPRRRPSDWTWHATRSAVVHVRLSRLLLPRGLPTRGHRPLAARSTRGPRRVGHLHQLEVRVDADPPCARCLPRKQPVYLP